MARQLFGQNGQPAGSTGGGSGGTGSITFVTIPIVTGGNKVAIGRSNKFTLSSECLLSNAYITKFYVKVSGTPGEKIYEAKKNMSEATITIPADAQVGAKITINVAAEDNYGNKSKSSEKIVTAANGYITTPEVYSPSVDSIVPSFGIVVIGSPFTTVGDGDIHEATQVIITDTTEEQKTIYDSGEITDPAKLTKLDVDLTLINMDVPARIMLRYRGKESGWSEYSPAINFTIGKDRLVACGFGRSKITSDLTAKSGWVGGGIQLPTNKNVMDVTFFKNKFMALTQGYDEQNLVLCMSDDGLNWPDSEVYTVGLWSIFSNPYFEIVNDLLFICGRSISKSEDGKSWTSVVTGSGAYPNQVTSFFGLSHDEKYVYYFKSVQTNSNPYKGTVELYRSDDGGSTFSYISTPREGTSTTSSNHTGATSELGGAAKNGFVVCCGRYSNGEPASSITVSSDYGVTWKTYPIDTYTEFPSFLNGGPSPYNRVRGFKGKIYICFNEFFVVSENSGANWTGQRQTGRKILRLISDEGKLSYFDSLSGYKETVDNVTWSSTGNTPASYVGFNELTSFVKTNTTSIVGSGPIVFRSSDLIEWENYTGVDKNISQGIDNGCGGFFAFDRFFKFGRGKNQSSYTVGIVQSSENGLDWDQKFNLQELGDLQYCCHGNNCVVLSVSLQRNSPFSGVGFVYTEDGKTFSSPFRINSLDPFVCAQKITYGKGYYIHCPKVGWLVSGQSIQYATSISGPWTDAAISSAGAPPGYASGGTSCACVYDGSAFVIVSTVINSNKYAWDLLSSPIATTYSSWSRKLLSTGMNVRRLIYGNGTFLMTDLGVNLAYGIGRNISTWSEPFNLNSGSIKDITYINGLFFVIFDSGKISYSENGRDWSQPRSLFESKSFTILTNKR